MAETQVEKFVRILGITTEEAQALIEDDKKIDKGEKMPFDLTAEQKKEVKKYISTGTRKPTVYKFDEKKAKNRKKDEEKSEIISKIAEFLHNSGYNCEIVNTEGKISLELNENSYSLTLTKHRKSK